MYRFERKYVIPHFLKTDINCIIKSSPFSCRNIHSPRQVNNIYFDSLLMQKYFENINGDNKKSKYRIRWYGEQLRYVETLKLEIKIKHNQLGHKILYPLNSFDTRKGINNSDIYTLLNISNLPIDLIQKFKFMQPILLNSYHRRYYESFDRKVRITIDDDLNYISLLRNKLTRNSVSNNDSILELKYNHEHNEYVSNLASYLPLKLTKYSKYITGIQNTINISD